MPTVTVSPITRPEDLIKFLSDYLVDSTIPVNSVIKYDEALLSDYPAIQIMPGQFQKDLHGTHTWLLTFRVEIFVMHSKMTLSRTTRTEEDLALATQVVAYLERDLSFGGRIIAGFVESETPNAMPPRSNKGAPIISTRLVWAGTTEARF